MKTPRSIPTITALTAALWLGCLATPQLGHAHPKQPKKLQPKQAKAQPKPVEAQPTQPAPVQGTDVGNGTGGDSRELSIQDYELTDPVTWCGQVGGQIRDALIFNRFNTNPADARAYLKGTIEGILAAYQAGSFPYQPLTYSLLSASLNIASKFPSGQERDAFKGNQSATIVLTRLMEAAEEVNTTFDMPQFVPMLQSWDSCDNHRCPGELGPSFYADYISAATTVLNALHSPAIPDRQSRGNILDAMAKDEWEVRALFEIVKWLEFSLKQDIFSRQLGCLVGQVQQVRVRLQKYLDGTAPLPFNDTTMRMFVEESLNDVCDQLNYIAFLDGVTYASGYYYYEKEVYVGPIYSCRKPPRRR